MTSQEPSRAINSGIVPLDIALDDVFRIKIRRHLNLSISACSTFSKTETEDDDILEKYRKRYEIYHTLRVLKTDLPDPSQDPKALPAEWQALIDYFVQDFFAFSDRYFLRWEPVPLVRKYYLLHRIYDVVPARWIQETFPEQVSKEMKKALYHRYVATKMAFLGMLKTLYPEMTFFSLKMSRMPYDLRYDEGLSQCRIYKFRLDGTNFPQEVMTDYGARIDRLYRTEEVDGDPVLSDTLWDANLVGYAMREDGASFERTVLPLYQDVKAFCEAWGRHDDPKTAMVSSLETSAVLFKAKRNRKTLLAA